MTDTSTTKELLNEVTKLADKGTKTGLTAEEKRRYEKGVAELRRSVNLLSAKRRAGATSASEEALLDRLLKTRETWQDHKGKPIKEVGETESGKTPSSSAKEGSKEYVPSTLDIPVFSEFVDEIAGTFGYGSRGNEKDRLSHVVGGWAVGRTKDRARDAFQGVVNRFKGGKLDVSDATVSPKRKPLVDKYGNVDGLDLGDWVPSGSGDVDDGPTEGEAAAWARKRYVEESSPVDSGYTKWMSDIQWKIQQAREGDPEMEAWYHDEYPKEAALWYRRMMGDGEQVAKDTQEAYSMGRPATEDTPSDDGDGRDTTSPALRIVSGVGLFGKSVGVTAKRVVEGNPVIRSVFDKEFRESQRRLKVSDEVWIHDHERLVNGKKVRVSGHKRHVMKNA